MMTRGTSTALILPTHVAMRSIRKRRINSAAAEASGSVGFMDMTAA